MSEKRKLESDSDTDSEVSPNINDCKRKAEDVAVDDEERNDIKRYEDKYSERYTIEDDEYKQCLDRQELVPPILINYFGKNRNRDRFRGNDRYEQRGRGGGGGGGRGGGGGGGQHYRQNNYNSYDNNQRSNWNRRPYNRY